MLVHISVFDRSGKLVNTRISARRGTLRNRRVSARMHLKLKNAAAFNCLNHLPRSFSLLEIFRITRERVTLALVRLARGMQGIAARDDRCSIIAVVYLIVFGGERVNIETVRIKKIGQLLRAVEVQRFRKSQFRADLKQAFNYLERCETLRGIFEGGHKIFCGISNG